MFCVELKGFACSFYTILAKRSPAAAFVSNLSENSVPWCQECLSVGMSEQVVFRNVSRTMALAQRDMCVGLQR